MTRAQVISLLSGTALLAFSGAATARSAVPSVAPSGAASDSDVAGADAVPTGEIIVTAQRQAQSLQVIPIAVSAFNAQALERQQIKNTSDLMLTLPNVTFTKTSFTSSSFTIRGVGDLCVGATCDQATGIHINGSPTPNTRLFETEFYDMERIEVLRGPQGTLFGRNATSGVVNFITARPQIGKFAASAEGEYGNYNGVKTKGMLNVPIGNSIAVRLAGFYLKRDGYTLNLANNHRIDDRDMYGLRGSLRWEVGPDTTIDLMGSYFNEKDHRMRSQKQLCHRDPTGVLGCLPDSRGSEYVNANGLLLGTLPSQQLFRAQGGAVLGAAFGALGLTNLAGPDVLSGQVKPSDPRIINTSFDPQYQTHETQIQGSLHHDFGKIKLDLTGMYSESAVASAQDWGQAVVNRSAYASALATLQNYATSGIPGIPGSAAYFAPAAAALMPNGPTGVLCSSVPTASNTGVFGGNRVCGDSPVTTDRSSLRTKTWSAELLLTSKFDSSFNFLLGATYLDNRLSDFHYNVNAFELDYAGAVLGALTSLGRTLTGTPTPPSYLGPTMYDNYTPDFRLKSYGLFGEAYWTPNDRLKVTLGLRYNHDQKENRARNQLLNFLVPYGTADAFGSPYAAGFDADPSTSCSPSGAAIAGAYGSVNGCESYAVKRATFSAMTGRAVFDYRITQDNMIYASYSRGYKSGGINPPLAQGLGASTTFNPEYLNAFEIGTKNRFANGALSLNASLFYYQYKGMQLSRTINRTAVNDNVDADIYGLEAEAVVRPTRSLSINLGFSYLHTRVTGDLFIQNPRDPAAGRDDAVIIKDISAAYNCVVTPTTAGNGAGARQLVSLVNGAVGLAGPSAFPVGSGVSATGAFSLCSSLAATIANPSAPLRALLSTPTGALPFSVTNVGLAQNVRGKQLPLAPNFKWNVGVQYEIGLGSGLSIVPRADLIYIGDSYGNIFNGPINRVAGYSQINAQVQVNGPEDRWYLRGWVQNLANSSAITGFGIGDQSQGLVTNIFTLEPRRYGLTAGVRF